MSGTDLEKFQLSDGPVVILVEPQLGENIGMVARAMANFGLGRMRIVNPRDGWPNEKARAASSGAVAVIDAVQVYADLRDAVADLKHVYATTARPRDMIKPVLGPVEAARSMRSQVDAAEPCGLLFGRERWGLNNDEISICDAIVTFPVNPGFASLNIAQAVLLMSYEWMKTIDGEAGEKAFDALEVKPASRRDLTALLDHLETALDDAGYFYPPEKRERMLQNLNGIFTHAGLSEPEIRTLHGVIAALERRWMKGRQAG